MFYQAPEFVGVIRNLHYDKNKFDWNFEIYINEILMKKGYITMIDKEKAIKCIKMIGDDLRKELMLKHELETCGDKVYVKWSTNLTKYGRSLGLTGFYGIYRKGKPYCVCGYDDQSLESALNHIKSLRREEFEQAFEDVRHGL